MSLLVTGSIGIDSVATPYGQVEGVLGGTAVYFSHAARQFSPVRLVGVVGEDFPVDKLAQLQVEDIDSSGLEIRKGSKTFRWRGKYEGAMNEAETVGVSLNVLEEAGPKVPSAFADSRVVFLANTHPFLQRELLSQLTGPELIVCDTMNLWITEERDELLKTLAVVHGVIINDGEARMLTGESNLIVAGRAVLSMGPRFVIIKKGEHGALMIDNEGVTAVPSYPTDQVIDPTGAGDSFAGGFLGFLAGGESLNRASMRSALLRGTVTASFAIEDFSLNRTASLTRDEVDQRVEQMIEMLRIT